MAARRPPPPFTAENGKRLVEALTQNQADMYRQFEAKLDAVIDRVDNLKASLQQDIRIVQQDVRIEGQERKALAVELNHVADELGKVRDSIALKKMEEAQNVATMTVTAAVPQVESAVRRGVPKRLQWPQWFAVVGVAIMVLATMAEKAPQTLRFIETTWKAWAKADK